VNSLRGFSREVVHHVHVFGVVVVQLEASCVRNVHFRSQDDFAGAVQELTEVVPLVYDNVFAVEPNVVEVLLCSP
jgi:hypothetical protein